MQGVRLKDVRALYCIPWTGVNTREVAVPEVACWAERVIAAVRSLFAFDNLAGKHRVSTNKSAKEIFKQQGAILTFAPGLSHPSTDLPARSANHTQSLRLIESANFLFRLAERHPVLQLPELGLRIRFLRFPRSVSTRRNGKGIQAR